jgi:threonine dehydratase
VLLKREDLQPVFSFKLRGAYNKIAQPQQTPWRARRDLRLGRQSRAGRGARGAAPWHAGGDRDAADHADDQGAGVIDLGGEVVLHGDDYDAAYEHALQLARERNFVFVHPFDDPDVIAGQGTIGMEIAAPDAR